MAQKYIGVVISDQNLLVVPTSHRMSANKTIYKFTSQFIHLPDDKLVEDFHLEP